jgi:hypothetical protein
MAAFAIVGAVAWWKLDASRELVVAEPPHFCAETNA